MIVSWWLHHITMQTRRMPDVPCTKGFSNREWKVLWAVREKTEPPNPTEFESDDTNAGWLGWVSLSKG